MNILIIGFGFVGKATFHAIISNQKTAGEYSSYIHDPAKGHTYFFDDKSIENSSLDAVFICVPTPSNGDGSCDYSIVKYYVEKFKYYSDQRRFPIIVRSTLPPSAIDDLLTINPDLVYVPEFLREKHWKEDSLNPKQLIIGCISEEMGNRGFEILNNVNYSVLPRVARVTPRVASLYKYASNTFLAMKVVFMHELYLWLFEENKFNEYDELVKLMSSDIRLGPSHYSVTEDHGFGFSGNCFPKDTLALAIEGSGNLSLIESVIKHNKRLRRLNK